MELPSKTLIDCDKLLTLHRQLDQAVVLLGLLITNHDVPLNEVQDLITRRKKYHVEQEELNKKIIAKAKEQS